MTVLLPLSALGSLRMRPSVVGRVRPFEIGFRLIERVSERSREREAFEKRSPHPVRDSPSNADTATPPGLAS